MKNTGQILKEKRESLNLTISEVALATKISPKILIAMEAGDSQNLPAQSFLKGFVKSYATFLKLELEPVMKIFMEEMSVQVVEAPREDRPERVGSASMPPTPRVRRVPEESHTTAKVLAVGSIVILIALIFGVRELIEKYQKETVVEQAQDLNVTPLPEPSPGGEVKPADLAEAAASGTALTDPSTAANPTAEAAGAKTDSVTATPQASGATDTSAVGASTASTPTAASPSAPATPTPAAPAPSADAKASETLKTTDNQKAAEDKAADAKTPESVSDSKPAAQSVSSGAVKESKKSDVSPVQEAAKRLGEIQFSASSPTEAVKAETPEPAKDQAPQPVDTKAELKKAKEEAEKGAANRKKRKYEVILEALDKVDVRLDLKGKTKRLSLAPTQVHTIRSDGPIQIDFSDGGAVSLTVNGQDRGVPGDLGKPKQVKIP